VLISANDFSANGNFANDLRTKNSSRLNSQAGMSLIEIMIVLVILGSIVTLIGRQVFENRKKAQTSQARVQIGELVKSVEMFYTDCQRYPTGEEGLKALIEAPADCKNWGPNPYARPNLLKDPWNQEMIYELAGSEFEIKTFGADKREGGKGVDQDVSSKD
jgi:general secretion pathway protein G